MQAGVAFGQGKTTELEQMLRQKELEIERLQQQLDSKKSCGSSDSSVDVCAAVELDEDPSAAYAYEVDSCHCCVTPAGGICGADQWPMFHWLCCAITCTQLLHSTGAAAVPALLIESTDMVRQSVAQTCLVHVKLLWLVYGRGECGLYHICRKQLCCCCIAHVSSSGSFTCDTKQVSHVHQQNKCGGAG